MKKKTLALLLAMVMVLGATIGVTLAWLTDKTDSVTNTFTVGDIKIELKETWNADGDDDDTINDHWEAQLIPGKEYTKDPVVSVDETETNVDCYLFVKFEEENTPTTYLTYTSTLTAANGWTLVNNTTNVWYRVVKTDDNVKLWHLLDGDKVTVNTALTKEDMPAADATPELVYTAYAIQKEGFATAELAWAEVSE